MNAHAKTRTAYSLLIGRFQPFHDGHKALVQRLLDEGKSVCVCVMRTGHDKDNPLGFAARYDAITEAFPDGDRVLVIGIPPVAEVVYGRDPGYDVRQIRLDSETEAISGTELREASRNFKMGTPKIGEA